MEQILVVNLTHWYGPGRKPLAGSAQSLCDDSSMKPRFAIRARAIFYQRSRIPGAGARRLRGFARLLRYAVCAAGFVIVLFFAHIRQVHGAGQDQEMARDMAAHMQATPLRPVQPGDQQRADAIVASARKVMDQFTDYRKALAGGYAIFLPGVKQAVYHFTRNADFHQNTAQFDPDRPTSLLYVKAPSPGPRYKLVGIMYAAPYGTSEDELNRRAPLSIARWHVHINLCIPPSGQTVNLVQPGAQFGFRGSIVTADACKAAGGRFLPHLSGWMLHVYAYETDPARIWSPGMDMDDLMDPAMPM
jgi:hypothetical protein